MQDRCSAIYHTVDGGGEQVFVQLCFLCTPVVAILPMAEHIFYNKVGNPVPIYRRVQPGAGKLVSGRCIRRAVKCRIQKNGS